MSEFAEVQTTKRKGWLSGRQLVLLLAMVGINLCVFSGMWMLSRDSDPAVTRPVLSEGDALELRQAHHDAKALALAWQVDAGLVGATSSWQVAAGDQLTLHRPAWSFSFYSPAAGQVKIVTVDQTGATAGPQHPVRTSPQHVQPDWNLGSDDLLLTFLSYGGQAFISAHPNANVHLQLKGESDDRSVWYVASVDPVTRQSLVVGVDALTRQVVSD